MFAAENIHIQIQYKKILEGVSVNIVPGKITAVMGPNGAGKSTLLSAFGGKSNLTQGKISLNNVEIQQLNAVELAQRRCVLLQSYEIPFSFRVEEVVLLATNHIKGHIYGNDSDVAEFLPRVLNETDTTHLQNRLYQTLSGGEKQRVQLARVLMQLYCSPYTEAKYVLLDEPVSSLDLKHQYQLMQLAQQLKNQGVGVFVILHDLNLVYRHADLTYLLKDGRLLSHGTTHEVLTPENIRSCFQVETEFVTTHDSQKYIITYPQNG